MKSDLKARLARGEDILGTMITVFDSPELAKMLAVVGFDYFIVDCEHGPFDYSQVAGLFAMAREAGIGPMIRIPEVRREVVLKAMEMGAVGILLPQTESADQARALVSYAKYAPEGNRGVSLLRAHTGFEKIPSAAGYMKEQNEQVILMTQIESRPGVEAIDAIMAVPGVDVAFIGPNDLSQSMGIMGQKEHPEFVAAIDKVMAAAKRNGKYSGIHLMDTKELTPWIAKGMKCNLWANDVTMLLDAARKGLAELQRT